MHLSRLLIYALLILPRFLSTSCECFVLMNAICLQRCCLRQSCNKILSSPLTIIIQAELSQLPMHAWVYIFFKEAAITSNCGMECWSLSPLLIAPIDQQLPVGWRELVIFASLARQIRDKAFSNEQISFFSIHIEPRGRSCGVELLPWRNNLSITNCTCFFIFLLRRSRLATCGRMKSIRHFDMIFSISNPLFGIQLAVDNISFFNAFMSGNQLDHC